MRRQRSSTFVNQITCSTFEAQLHLLLIGRSEDSDDDPWIGGEAVKLLHRPEKQIQVPSPEFLQILGPYLFERHILSPVAAKAVPV